MTKLTLAGTRAVLGIGSFVQKTIEFCDKEGNEYSGQIQIRILSHDEIKDAPNVWGVEDKKQLTIDQFQKAQIFHAVYSTPEEKFFSEINETGTLSTEVIEAMYKAVDEVLDLGGKNRILVKKKSSGQNLLSTESVDEPLPTPAST
ncbi:hypothetical protein ACG9WR_01460 [Acinetobacter pittii]|uniref:hypothetical protein n=1 Tax=Acinetobacter pittii TaxID=48296 RepID=UPI003AF5BB25